MSTQVEVAEREVAERMTALQQSLRKLAARVPGMRVEVVGHVRGKRDLVHPVAGFQVRMQPEEEGAGVALYVSASYAELTRWRGPDGEGGARRERFDVRLAEGYVWGQSEFPTADALAADLFAYLQYNFDRVADA